MARTRAVIERELAMVLDMRFRTKTPEVRDDAHQRVMELRAELAELKRAEARQAEPTTEPHYAKGMVQAGTPDAILTPRSHK